VIGLGASIRESVVGEVGKVVVGRERETELMLAALLAKGHVLLEGAPGVSKTLLAKAFSKCVGLDFRRVQFTPDMLPLDILGGFVFNMKTREFDFRKGAVFTNVLLADEVNRAPPKVQSALLESMQELQVTIEGHTEKIPEPFIVLATQNPLEYQGVYPLPEGQLDRFMIKVDLGYPDPRTEAEIIRRNLTVMDLADVRQVVSASDLKTAFDGVASVQVSDDLIAYVAEIGEKTRKDQRIGLGASPRALVQLVQAARAKAYLDGRRYVIPDDIKVLLEPVLVHRIRVARSASLKEDDLSASNLLAKIVEGVKPPR
jgi:MoxR-like ATPase